MLSLTIPGTPRPQGSLMLRRSSSGKEQAWYGESTVQHRNLVVGQVSEHWGSRGPMLGPVVLSLRFAMPRPVSHWGTGRNRGTLKESAPAYPVSAPDLDKLVRLMGDAVAIAGVIEDDAQVAAIHALKVYALHGGVGYTHVVVSPIAGGVLEGGGVATEGGAIKGGGVHG